MPKTWTTGELATATNLNLLPRVLYREVLSAAATSVTIEDADILGSLADWETLKITVNGDNDGSVQRQVLLRFNGDTGTNYVWGQEETRVDGQVTTRADNAATFVSVGRVGAALLRSMCEATVVGHSRSDRVTSVVGRSSAGANTVLNSELTESFGYWSTTDVVTSLTVLSATDDFAADTLIMLEGQMRREPS